MKSLTQLKALEAESIHIIREVAAEFSFLLALGIVLTLGPSGAGSAPRRVNSANGVHTVFAPARFRRRRLPAGTSTCAPS